jgi:preprotein translocase subunit SecB
MAEQDSTTPGNGSPEAGAGPQAAVLAQYIKDLSVESPSSPQVFQWQEQPSIDVQFNLNVEKLSEDVHELVMKLEVSARSDKGVHFLVDLAYGGLFGLRGFPQDSLATFMLLEAPRLLFPFARQIIAEATQNTGFPPLLLDPVDFGAAFMAQLQASQAQGAEGGAAADPGGEEGRSPGQDSES